MEDVRRLAREERESLLDTLRGLDESAWARRSLCADWTVRDVVAHVLSYEDLSTPQLLATFGRSGLRRSRLNETALRRFRTSTPADLVARLEAHLDPSGLTAALGGRIGLTDALIHHQDIRRALSLPPRTIPAERLRVGLDTAARAPTLPSPAHRRGLRLVADDIGWSLGDGPEVHGPAESVVMAMSGRADALDELTGPGVATLAGRVRR